MIELPAPTNDRITGQDDKSKDGDADEEVNETAKEPAPLAPRNLLFLSLDVLPHQTGFIDCLFLMFIHRDPSLLGGYHFVHEWSWGEGAAPFLQQR